MLKLIKNSANQHPVLRHSVEEADTNYSTKRIASLASYFTKLHLDFSYNIERTNNIYSTQSRTITNFN